MSAEEKASMVVNDSTALVVDGKLYDAAIIPTKKIEMWRKIVLKGNAQVSGAIFAGSLDATAGPIEIGQSIFVKEDMHFSIPMGAGRSIVHGCVQAVRSILVDGKTATNGDRLVIEGDVYADSVNLTNVFVYGNVFCKSAKLSNSVVLASIYADTRVDLQKSLVGTLATRTATFNESVGILHPAIVCENKPSLEGTLFYVLLDQKGSVTLTIGIGELDDISMIDQVETQETVNLVRPNHVIGIAGRVLNLSPIGDLLLESSETLARHCLLANSEKRDLKEEIAWEDAVVAVAANITRTNREDRFRLDDVELPAEELEPPLLNRENATLTADNEFGFNEEEILPNPEDEYSEE